MYSTLEVPLYAGSPNFSSVSLPLVCSQSMWLFVQQLYSLNGFSLLFARLDIVNWIRLLFWKITNLVFNTRRIILIMIRQSTLTSSIIWFVSKYNKGIFQLLRYPLRRTLLTFWPNLCMVIYSGSIYLLLYLLSMTISKFEDPRKFAIATRLVYLYRRWCIYGRTL